MSYAITAHVYQTNTNAFFHIAEKTVLTSGDWSEYNGQQILSMSGSGTSGSLRFLSDTGENFIVTLGVHNYLRWGDIVTNLLNNQTGVAINPEYYSDSYPDREHAREAQRTSYSVDNNKGRNFAFNYTVATGNNLEVDIIIG